MAKKYNKSREQKPNYSKRGKRLEKTQLEISKDFDLEEKIRQQKDNPCSNDINCSRDTR